MVPKQIMVIAGETSGDHLAAELVRALRRKLFESNAGGTDEAQPRQTTLEPRFFGAGGAKMAAAGVDLAVEMTAHAVVGISDVLKRYGTFRRIFYALLALARARQPHAIICVDFSGFNLRFARAVKRHARGGRGRFYNWEPKIIQFVSPQVWASRPSRAQTLEHNVDLLLSIFPFEKDWYATRAPGLQVEFVGHPLVDRYADVLAPGRASLPDGKLKNPESPLVLLLPGSRGKELARHVPVMAPAIQRVGEHRQIRKRMVVPDAAMGDFARSLLPAPEAVEIQVGRLTEALLEADLAIASTGTVTMECAYFGVPTVAIYKTSRTTYEIGKRMIQVSYLAMPNLLAGLPVYPEFIQDDASAANLAREAMDLLSHQGRRQEIQVRLLKLSRSLGPPGAIDRAAGAIVRLLDAAARQFPLRASLRDSPR